MWSMIFLRARLPWKACISEGLSPETIETLTKTLSSADGPPMLRKLALTSTMFEEGFDKAVVKLIAACGSHVTRSFAWLPTIVFREYIQNHFTTSALHMSRSHSKTYVSTRLKSNAIEKITLECHWLWPNQYPRFYRHHHCDNDKGKGCAITMSGKAGCRQRAGVNDMSLNIS